MSKMMSVRVRKAEIRSSPSFLSKIVHAVRYGDRLRTYPEKDSWVQVDFEKKRGWMHISALTKKEILLNPDAKEAKRAAVDDELALAGKGFNKQVEAKYRERHRNLSFEWVDKAETYKVSDLEIREFLEKGDLQAGGDK